MSMANRNDPGVRQHETLPGLSPGQTLSLPSGARPVEQMVDAAIERIAREHGLSHRRGMDCALSNTPSSPPTRLSWKGLDVSDEFREYAERVARGEDLPPFAGRVLAEPNAAFPWGPITRSEPSRAPSSPGRGGQLALWTSAAVVMALLGWSVALKLNAVEPPGAMMNAAAADDPSLLASVATPVAPAASDVAAMGQLEPVAPVGAVISDTPRRAPLAAPPSAAPSPQVPPAVAVSVAPPSPPEALAVPHVAEPGVAEPAAQQAPAQAAAVGPAPAGAQAMVQPATPAPKPVTGARPPSLASDPSFDFGIDELPLPSAGAKSAPGQVSGNSSGSVGDLARVAQPGGTAVRKEPGSESSAKGSLLVDNPSF